MFKFICHHCNNMLEHEEDLTGENVQCDECQGIFVVDQLEFDGEALPAAMPAVSEEPDVSEFEGTSTLGSAVAGNAKPEVNRTSDEKRLSARKKSVSKRMIAIGSMALALCVGMVLYLMAFRPLTAHTTLSPESAQIAKSSLTAKAGKAGQVEISAGTQVSTAASLSQVPSTDDADRQYVLTGKITGRSHPQRKAIIIYELHYGLEGQKLRASGPIGKNAPDIDYKKFRDKYVKLTGTGRMTEQGIWLDKITQVEPLAGADLIAYRDAFDNLHKRAFDASPNALPFAGTWGARMSLPTAKNPKEVQAFKVSDFAQQFSKLKSAAYVLVNVTQPSGPCYFSGSNPPLAKLSDKLAVAFTQRDLLGEVLDAIAKDGKKAIVYYACEGFYKGNDSRPQQEKDMRSFWDQYLQSVGMTNNQALGELIVGYYAKKYGAKISGWWFDGSNVLNKEDRLLWRKLVRAGNPAAMVAFNSMAGAPFRSTPECDYFGGHPTPRAIKKFWDKVNLGMIEGIEAGAWMDPKGNAVDDPGRGALGHVFMGMQDRWNFGKCKFPPQQAVGWTKRVVAAGGMYTWHAPRNGSSMAPGQFQLLLKIDAAITQMSKRN